jgi:putative transcriptional regulator
VKNRLRVLRAERGWSLADLAERLDVSRQSINAIETGKYDPSLPLAFKIARLFELPRQARLTFDLRELCPSDKGVRYDWPTVSGRLVRGDFGFRHPRVDCDPDIFAAA